MSGRFAASATLSRIGCQLLTMSCRPSLVLLVEACLAPTFRLAPLTAPLHRVRFVERVTLRAMRLARVDLSGFSPLNVDGLGDGLKMRGVYTRPIPTKMVELKAFWNGPAEKLISDTMGQGLSPVAPGAAISRQSEPAITAASALDASAPLPAPGPDLSFIHLGPKAICNRPNRIRCRHHQPHSLVVKPGALQGRPAANNDSTAEAV